MITHAGLLKTTLADYPTKVAAVLFLPGCNFRCPYCHNPDFLDGPKPGLMEPIDEILAFLDKRKKILGGVCISGGEPTIHKDLPELIETIRALGLPVKLDTNGTNPEMLETVKPDYVAMDLKAPLDQYDQMAWDGSAELLRQSIRWILNSGRPYEFRTTVVPGLIDEPEIRSICAEIPGAERYTLAGYRPGVTLDPTWGEIVPYSRDKLQSLADLATGLGIKTGLRFNQ